MWASSIVAVRKKYKQNLEFLMKILCLTSNMSKGLTPEEKSSNKPMTYSKERNMRVAERIKQRQMMARAYEQEAMKKL